MTRLYEAWLTTPSGGNLSVLEEDGSLWVTPTQIDKGRLRAEQMVRIAPDGSWTGELKPTSEWPFHRAVLQARPDCRAVAHAHPSSLVAFSVVGKALPLNQFPDLCRWLNHVGFTAYAIPGSEKLGQLLGETFATGCDAALMENHGAVACGGNLLEAYHRMEAMEHLATILLSGARLGELRPHSRVEMQEAREWMERAWETFECADAAAQPREELADYVRRAQARNLLGSVAGAFSIRHDDGFLIVPDGADNASLKAEDLVFVKSGRCEAGKIPDAMANLHAAVYAAHPHIHSVATALPPSLMAFAATGTPFDARTIPEAFIFLRSVPSLPFKARFNGILLAETLDARTPMALIESACAVVTGETPFQVFDRLEVAEFTARSLLDASAIGRLKPIGEEALEEIGRVFRL
jgi:L-fuculose-phosphate aldolase